MFMIIAQQDHEHLTGDLCSNLTSLWRYTTGVQKGKTTDENKNDYTHARFKKKGYLPFAIIFSLSLYSHDTGGCTCSMKLRQIILLSAYILDNQLIVGTQQLLIMCEFNHTAQKLILI